FLKALPNCPVKVLGNTERGETPLSRERSIALRTAFTGLHIVFVLPTDRLGEDFLFKFCYFRSVPRFTLSTLLVVAAAFIAGLAVGRYAIPRLQNRSAPVSLQINSLGENPASVRLIGPSAATPFPFASAQQGSA